MAFISDMKVLYHLLFKRVTGDSHAERMESFYGGQAGDYDGFRKRLLKGREELYQAVEKPADGIWVDMGGGTGANIENLADDIGNLKKVYVVDLSESLLKVAQDRFKERGWDNAETIAADATTFTPPEGYADVVTFSYSLTMIPDWKIGIVDFYVGRKFPNEGLKKHRWLARTLWPPWFSSDNVFPSPDHLPFLQRHFKQLDVVEERSKIPYVPFLRTPYYHFIGEKPAEG